MRLMLAPMEGVVDHTMRELITSLGELDRCVTEFVRVSERLLPPRVFYRLCPELHNNGRTASGVPVYLQLLGGQPNVVAENAARAAELGAPGIDLNFGCPAKTVNKSDGGSIILRQPERVATITAAVRRAVPEAVPVTVKTRLGYEHHEQFLDIIRGIADAGATEITVHARTKRHGYRPPAYWEEIARAREVVSLPLIANGEIWSAEDALRCREVSGCDDLMLGRGALCRPDLPRLVRASAAGASMPALAWPEVLELLMRYFRLTLMHYDAGYAGNPIKQWLVYLRTYYPQAALLFESIKRLRDADEIGAGLRREMADHGCRLEAA
ncbi:tRNA dihydrouridine(16) synthase DusC [Pseudohalioglobus sediminis]|uniref:tRNA-dihydrouridine(16) synthase n=1 Tax=Pseudohalioglobus sediminis TaxID=2606449 RepID=A0A5B0X1K8_9GAMM|nr:tRNA-dihydrouridine synthase [Pseudohalioglobus sediminis]KAA1192457.1 tRNA dihydrouridine(16) synthase DusC [Pseudohalioglobus sediminis]